MIDLLLFHLLEDFDWQGLKDTAGRTEFYILHPFVEDAVHDW